MRREGRGLFVWRVGGAARVGVRPPPPGRPPPPPLGPRGPSVREQRARAGVCGLLPSRGRPREPPLDWARGEGLSSWLSLRLSGSPLSLTPQPGISAPLLLRRCPPLARMRFHGEKPGRGTIGRQRSWAGACPPHNPASPPRLPAGVHPQTSRQSPGPSQAPLSR